MNSKQKIVWLEYKYQNEMRFQIQTLIYGVCIMYFYNLKAFSLSFTLSMEIFHKSKSFPGDEKYALTNQIRRSSRSVSSNIAEAYGKRRYPNHFISKLTDADSENLETQTWLKFAYKCNYIDKTSYRRLLDQSIQIGKLLYYMMSNPAKFGSR